MVHLSTPTPHQSARHAQVLGVGKYDGRDHIYYVATMAPNTFRSKAWRGQPTELNCDYYFHMGCRTEFCYSCRVQWKESPYYNGLRPLAAAKQYCGSRARLDLVQQYCRPVVNPTVQPTHPTQSSPPFQYMLRRPDSLLDAQLQSPFGSVTDIV